MAAGWHEQLVSMRGCLMRTARARLRNDEWAADAVGEVMLAALERPPAFDEPGRIRAWLFGMLRHKLVDEVRAQSPQRLERYGLDPSGTEPVGPNALAWVDPTPGPEERLHHRRFLQDLGAALEHLPAQQRKAFVMRDVLDDDPLDACAQLRLTPNHLAVCLHRARKRLRGLLVDHAPGAGA